MVFPPMAWIWFLLDGHGVGPSPRNPHGEKGNRIADMGDWGKRKDVSISKKKNDPYKSRSVRDASARPRRISSI